VQLRKVAAGLGPAALIPNILKVYKTGPPDRHFGFRSGFWGLADWKKCLLDSARSHERRFW